MCPDKMKMHFIAGPAFAVIPRRVARQTFIIIVV
jgi:hypothetical protein